jgi:hypothetical protein
MPKGRLAVNLFSKPLLEVLRDVVSAHRILPPKTVTLFEDDGGPFCWAAQGQIKGGGINRISGKVSAALTLN